jgi:hypothetical protein
MTVPMTPLGSITHVIAGLPTAGSGTRVGPVFDPATGVQQAQVRLAFAADVDEERPAMGGFDQRAVVRVDGSQGGGGRRPGLGRRPTTTPRGAARSPRAGLPDCRSLEVVAAAVGTAAGWHFRCEIQGGLRIPLGSGHSSPENSSTGLAAGAAGDLG